MVVGPDGVRTEHMEIKRGKVVYALATKNGIVRFGGIYWDFDRRFLSLCEFSPTL